MSRMRRLLLPLLAACGLAAATPAPAETVLRAVMHSDLKIIDPIWTTALISAHHFFSTFHNASDGVCSTPLILVRNAVGTVNWPSGANVG